MNKGKLIKITDVLGREMKEVKNEPLFYIYDDGAVEKKIILEKIIKPTQLSGFLFGGPSWA